MFQQKLLSVTVAGILLLTSVFVVSVFAAPKKPAVAIESQAAANRWEYGRLLIQGDLVSWQGGETNNEVQVLDFDVQYRRLGGKFRPSLTNLLNVIGNEGWELVATDEINWTFKRGKQIRN